MLRGQGLKVAVISVLAVAFGIATAYYQPKVNHDGPVIAGVCALFQLMLTMWACVIITRAKAMDKKWCLMGLLGLIGVVTLLCIPAKKGEDMPEETIKDSEKPPSPIT